MSVAYDRFPEWDPPPAAAEALRAGRSGRAERRPGDGAEDRKSAIESATVIGFPLRRALPERPVPSAPVLLVPSPVAPPEAEPALAPGEPPVERPVATPAARPSGPWRVPARVRPRPARGPLDCPASAPHRASAPGLRLTRRGRLVLMLMGAAATIAVIALTVWVLVGAFSRPVLPDSAPSVVVVHSGESLWTIAHDIAPDSDPRRVVAALQVRNHLPAPVVHPGQTLQVPK